MAEPADGSDGPARGGREDGGAPPGGRAELSPLGLAEAQGLLGARLDAVDGPGAGRLDGVFVDARDGEPTWLCVRRGRRRGRTVVPADLVAGGAGRAWTPLERDAIRSAPELIHDRGLNVGEERQLATHYGIPAAAGRPAALTGRDFAEPGSVQPS